MSRLVLIALVLAATLALASAAFAGQPMANDLLLNDGSGSAALAPTSTTVRAARLVLGSSNTIASPLQMERNHVKWDEFPNLPTSDLTQDSLNRAPSSLGPDADDVARQRPSTDAIKVVRSRCGLPRATWRARSWSLPGRPTSLRT